MMDALEAMGTARAMRWLRGDPVADETIETLIWAATRASSAHNSEPWDFVVVRRADLRRRIGDAIGAAVRANDPMPPPQNDADRRIDRGVRNLFEYMADAPVLVFICARNCYPHGAPNEKYMWSAIGGATQNMIVAARTLGIGMAPTMFHVLAEPQIREIIGLPDDREIGVTAVIGWPDRSFGPLTRRPLDELVHHDVW